MIFLIFHVSFYALRMLPHVTGIHGTAWWQWVQEHPGVSSPGEASLTSTRFSGLPDLSLAKSVFYHSFSSKYCYEYLLSYLSDCRLFFFNYTPFGHLSCIQ